MTTTHYLSSNNYSHDIQIMDALAWLRKECPADYGSFYETFPEMTDQIWAGEWLDTAAMGVEPDYSSWLVDWLETNTDVTWDDGEPVVIDW